MIPRSPRPALAALLFAAAFTTLFWPVSIRHFERLAVAVHKGPLSLGEEPRVFAFEPPGSDVRQPWVLALKLSGRNPLPGRLAVSVGDAPAGVVDLPRGTFDREFLLALPAGLLRQGRNELALGSGPASVRVERVTVKNFLGFSRGWVSFIVLPEEAEVRPGLSWPATAALFLALAGFFFLGHGRSRRRAARRYEVAAAALTALVAGGASIAPLVGGPKVLFAAGSLGFFVLVLNGPLVFGGLAAALGYLRARLKTSVLSTRPLLGWAVCLALAAGALAFNLGFMRSVLRTHGGNYSGFLHIYPETLEKFGRLFFPGRANPLAASLVTTIQEYDGQYFYFMAFDPLLSRFRRDPEKYRWFIDEPAYRYHRVGFPLLVRLLSFGRPDRYPAVAVGIIVVAVAVGVLLLGRILLLLGQSPFWAALYPLIPGFHLSLYFGLPEPVAVAFLLAGVYFYLRRKMALAAAFLAGSLLIRETGLLLVAALAAFEFFKKKDLKRALILGAAVLPLALWRGFVTWRLFPVYGLKTLWFGPGDLTLPFLGLGRLVGEIFRGTYLYPDLGGSTIAYAALLAVLFAAACGLAKRETPWGLGLLLSSLLSVSLNLEKIWLHVDNAARGTYEPFVLLLLAALAGASGRKPRTKVLLAGFFALVLAYDLFFARLSAHVGEAFGGLGF
jgi:hypothetical protein